MRTETAQRYHGLDSLRAVMMLAGIWMHGVQSYTVLPGYNWPLKDAARHEFFDVTLWFVHTHRMHIFYAMAGFFAALLFARRGPLGVAANRAKRILLPFAAGWCVLYPVTFIVAMWARAMVAPGTHAAFRMADFVRYAGPLHLWFLEYLVLLCAIYIPAAAAARRWMPGAAKRGLRTVYACLATSRWRVALCSGVYFVLVLLLGGYVGTPESFVPNLRILAAYAIFFGFGWMLYLERAILPRFRDWAWTNTAAGTAAALVMYWLSNRAHAPHVWYTLTSSFSCWFLLFGLTGLFLRYFDRPMPAMRYLSDSSYWMYLIHVPLVIAFQGALAQVAIPGLAKGLLVVGAAMPVLLASYHYIVRSTWMGVALNGRRYERALPKAAAAPAPAILAAESAQ